MTTIYQFDPTTGEYQGEFNAKTDPFGNDLLPPDNHKSRTTDSPPEQKDGYSIVRSNGQWTYIEDLRGQTIYSTETGLPKAIDELGPIPEGYTTLERPEPYYVFSDGQWIEDQELKRTYTVPQTVTPLQARKALRLAGLKEAVDSIVDNLDEETREEWEYAVVIERSHPMIEQLGTTLGLSANELDDLFVTASQL